MDMKDNHITYINLLQIWMVQFIVSDKSPISDRINKVIIIRNGYEG